MRAARRQADDTASLRQGIDGRLQAEKPGGIDLLYGAGQSCRGAKGLPAELDANQKNHRKTQSKEQEAFHGMWFPGSGF